MLLSFVRFFSPRRVASSSPVPLRLLQVAVVSAASHHKLSARKHFAYRASARTLSRISYLDRAGGAKNKSGERKIQPTKQTNKRMAGRTDGRTDGRADQQTSKQDLWTNGQRRQRQADSSSSSSTLMLLTGSAVIVGDERERRIGGSLCPESICCISGRTAGRRLRRRTSNRYLHWPTKMCDKVNDGNS